MIDEDPTLANRGARREARSDDIRGIVLSPTRELAEQIAVAADVEVVRGKLEARAERLQRLQHGEPALGLRRDLLLRRQREQRVRPQLGAADAAAELIEQIGRASCRERV